MTGQNSFIFSPRGKYLILGFFALAVLLIPIHLILSPYAYDDAYIHIRIANHVASYGVPYFNLNEAVSADSSPGWVIVLALLFRLTTVNLQLVSVLNALITAASTILFSVLVRDLIPNTTSRIFYFIFGLLFLSLTIQSSIGLMEIPSAMFLMSIALLFLLNSKPYAFILFGLLISFRPEFVVLFILALTYAILGRRFSVLAVVGYGLIGVLPFLAYQLYFFHTLVLNSMLAKAKVYDIHPLFTLSNIVSTLLPSLNLPFLTWSFDIVYVLILVTLCILIALDALAARFIAYHQDVREHITALVMMFGVAVVAAYVANRVLVFAWYAPIYSVPIVLALCRTVLSDGNRLRRYTLAILTIPIVFSLLASLLQVSLSGTVFPLSLYPEFLTGARVRKYIQVGDELARNCPDKTLVSPEIGGLGFGFKGNIMDAAGLVSPQALQFHPMKMPDERSSGWIGAMPVGFVDISNPQLIVGYDIFVQAFLKSKSAQGYVRIQAPIFLEGDMKLAGGQLIWGSENLNVFVRRDLAENGVVCYANVKSN